MINTYNKAAAESAKVVTNTFSTSFSIATKMFDPKIRGDIYNIYGMVRVADEIVDTYAGPDMQDMLDEFESSIYDSLKRGYSSDVIVHAFVLTARKYKIDKNLIKPFFTSMRTDIDTNSHTQASYRKYIYGSADVVGLMCLRVFCLGNTAHYESLKDGAAALGSAFQKVNFLRDMGSDWNDLGRYYFPIGSYEGFDEYTKKQIEADIDADFAVAAEAIERLPRNSQLAVRAAFDYYTSLHKKIKKTPVDQIKTSRIRISNPVKLTKLSLLVFREPFRF